MFSRKAIGTSVCLLAAAPAIKTQETPKNDQGKKPANICRPSDLPIYPPPMSTVTRGKTKEPSYVENMLLGPVSTVRKTVVDSIGEAQNLVSKASDTVSETAKNFNFVVAYLREEENEPQRYGAVAMGTLTGYIFGLRGGIIKKLFYSAIGTGIMGSICFPEQASVYYAEGVNQGKLATKIAYNFIYGVKPGDPQPDINFPDIKIPHNFSEAIDLGKSLGTSIKNAVMPDTTEEKKSPEPPKK